MKNAGFAENATQNASEGLQNANDKLQTAVTAARAAAGDITAVIQLVAQAGQMVKDIVKTFEDTYNFFKRNVFGNYEDIRNAWHNALGGFTSDANNGVSSGTLLASALVTAKTASDMCKNANYKMKNSNVVNWFLPIIVYADNLTPNQLIDKIWGVVEYNYRKKYNRNVRILYDYTGWDKKIWGDIPHKEYPYRYSDTTAPTIKDSFVILYATFYNDGYENFETVLREFTNTIYTQCDSERTNYVAKKEAEQKATQAAQTRDETPPVGYAPYKKEGESMNLVAMYDFAWGMNGKFNYLSAGEIAKKGLKDKTITDPNPVFGDPVPYIGKILYSRYATERAKSASKASKYALGNIGNSRNLKNFLKNL